MSATLLSSLRAAAFIVWIGAVVAGCGGGSIKVSQAAGDPSGTLLLDLVERAESASVRADHSRYDFDDDGEGVLIDGWSEPQGVTGTDLSFGWATSRHASLRLQLVDPESGWLHVRCQPFLSESGTAQAIVVAVDEVEVGSVELADGGFATHSFRLPDGAVKPEGTVISFSFAYAEAPPDNYPGAGDAPALAAAFDYVAVTATREPPANWQTASAEDYGVRGDHLFQPTGSEAVFLLTVPDGGLLEFGVREATGPEVGERSTPRAEVSLRRPEEGEEVFFSRSVDTDDTRWRADLAAAAGEDVELIFRVVGGNGASRGVEWIEPRLYGEVGDLDVTTNVVLLIVDTLRADYLGSYGSDAHTPNMDALASSGVRFEHAYSHAPMTVPSHSSMFTSLLATEHAALNNGDVLSAQHLTLPELLRQTAYRHTAAFVSLGVLKSQFGVAQGFTEYHERFGPDWWKSAEEINAELVPWLRQHPPTPFFLWAHYSDPHEPYAAPIREYASVQARLGNTVAATLTADGRRARFWVDVPPGETELEVVADGQPLSWPIRIRNLTVSSPEIAVVCGSRCQAGHQDDRGSDFVLSLPATLTVRNSTDSVLSTEFRAQVSENAPPREIRHRYREEVEYVDRQIGVMLSALWAETQPENTLIIFTADHGEELFEHGPSGHVARLYDPVIRVPFIISWPGRLPAGVVVKENVSHIDLLPTVLELLNVRDLQTRSGRSLGPLLAQPSGAFTEEPVVAETFRPEAPKDRQALILNRHKLILTPADQTVELYDLDQDPGERGNLATRDTETTAHLSRLLRARLAQAGDRALPSEQSPLTEEQLERLRSLGYFR